MINILVSLSFFAAVKRGFLWIFESRHDWDRTIANAIHRPEHDVGLVERHDRRDIGPSIRSEVHALTCPGTPDSGAPDFSFRAPEQFVEGR